MEVRLICKFRKTERKEFTFFIIGRPTFIQILDNENMQCKHHLRTPDGRLRP